MHIDIINAIRNIPIKTQDLAILMGEIERGCAYRSTSAKMNALEKAGEIIRLKRGLYVLQATKYGYPPSAPICSNHIYGPSYLSLQWALSHYGLIPERVNTLTAITLKHTRSFENQLGYFTYRQVAPSYYPIGITNDTMDGATFLIATPEKALCDLILSDTHIPSDSMRGLYRYLEEDIRFDMDELKEFNTEIISACAEQGLKQSTLLNLIKIIQVSHVKTCSLSM